MRHIPLVNSFNILLAKLTINYPNIKGIGTLFVDIFPKRDNNYGIY